MAIDLDKIKEAEEEIIAECEKLGRMTEEQEDVLYNIALRQDELGRQPTNMLYSKVKDHPVYQPLIDRELLTCDIFGNRGNSEHAIASLYVTLKGMRYCIVYGDEIHARRPVDPAGSLKASK